MSAPIRHILPLTTIRRERLLPVAGRVIVRKGQKVGATDAVAETRLTPEHLLLDVRRGLKVSQEKADRVIQCKIGMKVAEGDILAGPVGLTRRVIRAPKNGRVVLTGEGQILLEIENPPYELRAGFPGTVIELVDERGVIIEASGALVQGVWGNGRIDFGLMYVLAHTPDETLTADKLDVSHRGSIVLGGYCDQLEVLKVAGELPVRGLVLASMNAALLNAALRARYPIIVLDGFGHLPMNSAAFKLLTTNERREAALIAEPWNPYTGVRPEVFIPLPVQDELPFPPETEEFTPGKQVYSFRAPYAGKIGVITEVLAGTTVLPNGLATQVARVQLENGESVLIPLANLEILL